ncbi:MAG: hypothetical protein BroJett011_33040 [Chloroflexota bacterium]|nr:MAG: hypothetical protein BroJett011_33040 [Chloroflexota bacterium]
MSTVGGKFTVEKRNLVTYIENKDYELLRKLAALYGRSISAEAALAIQKHLQEHAAELGKEAGKK